MKNLRSTHPHITLDPDSFRAHGLVCTRAPDGTAFANCPHWAVDHSPDGYEWGYLGSGPADLALNVIETILRMEGYHGPRVSVWQGRVFRASAKLHQAFKVQFIGRIPREGGSIPYADMKDWILKRVGNPPESEVPAEDPQ